MLKAILIDDEPLAREVVKEYLLILISQSFLLIKKQMK